jgi:nucleoside-diphosphate-sugar epimerase
MIYKGTVGTGGTIEKAALEALTTYNAGWSYRVITAGTYFSVVCQVGDIITAIVDRAGSGDVDADWTVVQTNIDGAVVGPASDVKTQYGPAMPGEQRRSVVLAEKLSRQVGWSPAQQLAEGLTETLRSFQPK